MKKAFRIVLTGGILLALGTACGGYYLFNRLAKDSRPAIESYAGEALGSKVSLGDIRAAILPGAAVSISGFTAGNPELDEELSLGALRLMVDLMPLTRGELAFSGISLDEPNVTLLMETEGIRVAGIPRKSSDSAASTTPDGAGVKLPLNVNIQRLEINNGRVELKDPASSAVYALGGLNLKSAVRMGSEGVILNGAEGHVSLLDRYDVAIAAKQADINSATAETRIDSGTVSLLGQTVNLDGAIQPGDAGKQMKIHSEAISLEALMPVLASYVPALEGIMISGKASPDISVALGEEDYAVAGTATLSGGAIAMGSQKIAGISGPAAFELNSKKQAFSTQGLDANWNGVPMRISLEGDYAGEKAALKRLELAAFGGSATASGGLNVGEDMPFSFNAGLKDLALPELLTALAPELPIALKGKLTRFDTDMKGRLSGDLAGSLEGTGSVLLEDGLLEQVNLAALVLDAVKGLPFLADTLLSKVPAQLREQVDRDYTILERVEGSYRVSGEKMHSDDLSVTGELFQMKAKGWVGMDMSTEMKCALTFTPDFSAALAASLPELKVIYDKDGQLLVPLSLSGTLPGVTVRPDMDALMKQGVKETVKQKAVEQIDKLLKDDGKEGDGSTKDKAKSLIRGLLN